MGARDDTKGLRAAAFVNVALLLAVLATGGLVLIGPATFALPTAFQTAPKVDFNAFYGASAQLAARDFAALYDYARFETSAPALRTLAWLYPPTMLLLIEPLAALPYPVAKAGWLIGTLAAFALACRQAGLRGRARMGLLLTSAPVLITLGIAQASAFFLLPLLVAATEARARPVLAGVCAGLLTVKPQYGLVLPILFLALRAHRAFGVAALTALLLAAASLARFGPYAWHAYLTEGVAWGQTLAAGEQNLFSVTLYRPLSALGLSDLASWVHGLLVLAVWACVLATGRKGPATLAVGVGLIGTGLAAPYFHTYDYAVILCGALAVAQHAGAPRLARVALPVLFAVPTLCWFTAAFAPLRPAGPLVLAAGIASALAVLVAAASPYLAREAVALRRPRLAAA